MATRVFSHPRSRRARQWQARLEQWSRGQISTWILRIGIAVLAVCIVVGLGLWRHVALQLALSEARTAQDPQVQELQNQWFFQPVTPLFEQGDEPHVQQWLAANPLIIACYHRPSQTLWVRQGGVLTRSPEAPYRKEAQDLITLALQKGRTPQYGLTFDDQGRITGRTINIAGSVWMTVKLWAFGSQVLEGHLGQAMSSQGPRLCVVAPPWEKRPVVDFEDTTFQMHPSRLKGHPLAWVKDSGMFWEGWKLWVVPSRSLNTHLLHLWHVRFGLAVAIALLIAALTGMALLIRNRARARAVVDSDRMASLIHSLKTPLAVLRLRCDTVRFGNPDEAARNRTLMRLGEEVEDLTRLIERSLDTLRGPQQVRVVEPVDESLLMELVEEFRTLLEMEDRSLVMGCPPVWFQVDATALETALRTLLENALLYGKGTVLLQVTLQGGQAEVRVRDEGPGLSQAQLATLGRPFQRFRERGNEGFGSEGQGLGFSLLAQRAAQEGWGLQVVTSPGQGFDVRLLIPAVERR